MVGDNQIDTRLDVRSHVENNSINDSVFYNSSISLDVVCGCGLILVTVLTVLLFLRNAKKIRQLERESVIILRLLRKRTDLNPESQC